MSQIFLNNSVIMGRITHDPDLRYTADNIPVCSFQLAVPRPLSDGTYKTNFIPCVAWREKAQFISQWFAKGMLMIVVGELTSRTWTDQDNKTRVSIEILCNNVRFGETKKKVGGTHSSLRILVVDAKNDAALSGAAFDLSNANGEIIRQGITTDEHGTALITGLQADKYILTETAAPAGYDVLPNTHVLAIDAGVDHTITYLHHTYRTAPVTDAPADDNGKYIGYADAPDAPF